MSQQIINLGLIPNDGSGDALRVGAQKINENFTELYERGIPEQAGNNGKFLTTSGTVLRWDRVTDITGNAATVTNGIYTTGSYNNPSWIASLSPSKVLPTQSGNNGKYLTTDGSTLAWVDLEAVSIFDYNNLINRPVFPDNTSDLVNDSGFITSSALTGYATETYVNSRGFITSNGLPSQSSNAGKYLTTNGTTLSWATVTSGTTDYNNLTNKPTIPTSFDRLVNSTKTVSLASTGVLSLPAQVVPLTDVSQITSGTINRTGASTDTDEIAAARDNWLNFEYTWTDLVNGDFQTSGYTWPWTGKPSWEGYPLLQNYNSSGPGAPTPPPGTLPPSSALAPAGNTAINAYLDYKELASNIDIVSGNMTFSFENSGALRVPGVITKDNSLILQSSGVSGVLPTGNSASINPNGNLGRVFIRTDNGTTLRTWQFDIDGVLALPGNLTFPDLTVQTTAYIPGDIRSNSNINIDINLADSTLRRWQFGEDGALTLPSVGKINNGAYDWTFGSTGNTTFPTGLTLGAPRGVGTVNFTAAVDKEFQIETGTATSGKLWQFGTNGSLTLPGDIRSNGNINIDINLADSTLRRWQFGEDGKLTFPDGANYAGQTVTMPTTTIGNTNSFVWEFSDNMFGSDRITLNWNLLASDTAGFYIGTTHSTTGKYLFLDGTDQSLSYIAGDGLFGGGKLIFGSSAGNNAGDANAIEIKATNGDVYLTSTESVKITVDAADSSARIWTFDPTGSLTFPNATVQTTAYTGVPSLSMLTGVAITTPSTGQVLKYNGTNWINDADATTGGAGAGTVTTVSVTSANGFTGTVATASSTPAITIATSITGMLKGDATAISAAVAGTDYQAPIGTISGLVKGNGANALTAATSGTDYAPGTSALATGIVKSTTTTGVLSIAVAGTDYQAPITRTTANATTASLANAATGNLTITGFKGYVLYKIETSAAAWVRIYTDVASRTADAGRSELTDPLPGAGVIAEVITTGAETILISPGSMGFSNESTPSTNIQLAVTNKSGSTAAITVTLTVLQLEA